MKKLVVYFANRPLLVLVTYIMSLLVAAYLFSLYEGKTFGEGLWWGVVTALTIGYGDYSPATREMRLIAAFFQHLWILGLLPIVIANFVSTIIEDRNRFTHDEQEWTLNAMEQIAKKIGVELSKSPRDY
jgi:voltage-gated potassium channel